MLSKCESIPERNTAHKINASQMHMQLAVSSFFSLEAQLREETELEGTSQLLSLALRSSAEMALHNREILTGLIHLRAKIHGLLNTYPIIFRTQAAHTLEKHQVFKHTVIAALSTASYYRAGPSAEWRWAR